MIKKSKREGSEQFNSIKKYKEKSQTEWNAIVAKRKVLEAEARSCGNVETITPFCKIRNGIGADAESREVFKYEMNINSNSAQRVLRSQNSVISDSELKELSSILSRFIQSVDVPVDKGKMAKYLTEVFVPAWQNVAQELSQFELRVLFEGMDKRETSIAMFNAYVKYGKDFKKVAKEYLTCLFIGQNVEVMIQKRATFMKQYNESNPISEEKMNRDNRGQTKAQLRKKSCKGLTSETPDGCSMEERNISEFTKLLYLSILKISKEQTVDVMNHSVDVAIRRVAKDLKHQNDKELNLIYGKAHQALNIKCSTITGEMSKNVKGESTNNFDFYISSLFALYIESKKHKVTVEVSSLDKGVEDILKGCNRVIQSISLQDFIEFEVLDESDE